MRGRSCAVPASLTPTTRLAATARAARSSSAHLDVSESECLRCQLWCGMSLDVGRRYRSLVGDLGASDVRWLSSESRTNVQRRQTARLVSQSLRAEEMRRAQQAAVLHPNRPPPPVTS